VSDVQTLTHAGCNGDGLATVTSTPLVPIKVRIEAQRARHAGLAV
jgi:hypothetical protein